MSNESNEKASKPIVFDGTPMTARELRTRYGTVDVPIIVASQRPRMSEEEHQRRLNSNPDNEYDGL